MPESPVPTGNGQIGRAMKSADNPHNPAANGQNPLGGQDSWMLSGNKENHSARRTAKRFRTNGIVALTSLAEPVVSNLYDIAPGGVSFLHVNDMEVSNSDLQMDILIFDSATDFEYFVSQVKGRVLWKELVADPENNKPIWRFHVQFLDLDSLRESKLGILRNLAQNATAWYLDERLPKISYDS